MFDWNKRIELKLIRIESRSLESQAEQRYEQILKYTDN